MTAAAPRRAFNTLDGLRGVGAFLVVIRHVPLFGALHVPESFLAVDLFYLVSGFVVSHAYAQRLKAGGFFIDFVKTRIIRLYPLYAMGLALGVVPALISIFFDPVGWWSWGKLALALATGAVMFPLLTGMPANGSSLDGPTWTLLPELAANALYALLVRYLSVPVLLIIIAVSGLGLVHAVNQEGTLDVGYDAGQLWMAMARVGYSFFAGVLVHRFFGRREHRSNLISWGLMVVLAVILGITADDDWVNQYELAVVLVGFPLLLIAAACFEPGPRAGKLFSVVGLISYGVYIIHQPIGNICRQVIKRVPLLNDPTGIVSGTLFMAGVVALAWWLDRAFDAPVRKLLRGWFMKGAAKAV